MAFGGFVAPTDEEAADNARGLADSKAAADAQAAVKADEEAQKRYLANPFVNKSPYARKAPEAPKPMTPEERMETGGLGAPAPAPFHAMLGYVPPPAAPAPDAAPLGPPKPPAVKFASPGATGEVAGSAAAQPGINWGGGGGTATIPAREVPLASAARQGELMGAIAAQGNAVDAEGKALDAQKVAAGATGDAREGVEIARGIGEIDAAKAAVDAGQGVKDRAKVAADEAKMYRDRINDFSEKVAKDKIDPNGMWNNASTGQQITWTIAKMLGAVGQAFLHLPTNQVADQLEKMAAQDVAAQRANHEIGRERVADMNTMYGQALHATGNAEEAERVATGYALEAVKHQAKALEHSVTGKVEVAKIGEFIADIGARQAQLGEKKAQVDEKKAEKGIALNPMAQARTVATGPDMKQIGKDMDAYLIKMAEMGTKVTPDEAFRYAIKKNTGNDPLPGAGAFVQGTKAEKGDKKDSQASIDEVNHQYDNLLKSPVLGKLGFMPAVAEAGGFQRLMPESSAVAPELSKFNIMMDSFAGKLLKDNEGRIPPAIVDQLHKFHVKPGDTEAYAKAQVLAHQEYVNSLARTAGSRGIDPNAGTSETFKK